MAESIGSVSSKWEIKGNGPRVSKKKNCKKRKCSKWKGGKCICSNK